MCSSCHEEGVVSQDGLKMGKSLGNVLDPAALVGAYGSDAVRFYFMKEIRFGQARSCTLTTSSPRNHYLNDLCVEAPFGS